MVKPNELFFSVEGMDCPACALKVEAGARSVAGVQSAVASAMTGGLKVGHDGRVRKEDVIAAVEARGFRVTAAIRKGEAAPAPACRDEACDCGEAHPAPACRDEACGGDAHHASAGHAHAAATGRRPSGPDAAHAALATSAAEFRRRMTLTGASGAMLVIAFVLRYLSADGTWPVSLATALFLVSTVLGGYLVARKAFQSLRHRIVSFEVLMVIAASGAIAIGNLPEASIVVFLFSVGEALEAVGVARTRRALSSLLDLVPQTALVRRGGVEQEIPASAVVVGDVVVIRPGERLAVDGRILIGQSFVNQAPVTGESMPAAKAPGDEVFAGTINGSGVLEVVSTRDHDDTTLARIVHLVEEAQLEKARHQKTIDRFAAIYTPLVVGGAIVTGLGLPLVLGQPFEPFVYRALSLLLVACPCALVISTPVAVVSAIGQAARHGVLIKGGLALEAAGRVRVVAFDKTGTLTVGRPEVSSIVVAEGDGPAAETDLAAEHAPEKALLSLAAAVERRSEHPLAGAIRRKAEEWGIPVDDSARNFEAIPGRGAKARVGGRNCYVGSEALFEVDLRVSTGGLAEAGDRLERQGKTVIYVGSGDRVLGLIAVSDVIRPEAADAVAALRKAGVERLYLLTGDNPVTAQAVAESLGLDSFRAGLLPEAKVAAVRELAAAAEAGRSSRRGALAMVGDGINDAPALAAAGVGVAMGVAGTDQAIEAADIALMSDDLRRIAYTVRLGRRAVGVIRQNIATAVGIKAVALLLAATGFLPLWLAVLSDTGNSVLVILNGLRLLGGKEE